MKNLFLLIFIFITSLFSNQNDFLNPEDAFKVTVKKYEKNIKFTIKLDKTIYIYDEFLEVIIKKPKNIDITKKLNIQKPVEYHSFKVHFGEINIDVPLSLIEQKIGKNGFELELLYQGCSKKGLCYSPMSKTYSSENVINETDSITQTLKTGSLFLVLITFFGFGLLLAMTPCIFPMIPILSSIIVQQSKQNGGEMSASRGFCLSLVYVLAMSVAYTLAGVLAGVFGANIQAMLQNPFVIIGFVLVFIALAFSMFGYYEIGLPQSWQTKLNKTSDNSSKNGMIGIAVMGFLSALIVGPCVAPPLAGALVYIGQTGDALLGGLALFVMSLGMGMPLLLIGAGSGKFMPKPGGWMTTVSKVFGVVMLGVAIWMLDKIVPEILTISLFVLLFLGSAFYLIKNGNKVGKIVAIILVILSMFLTYNTLNNTNQNTLSFKYIKTIQELETIVSTSKKPIMIDFWATWCTSCVEFDKITFQDKEVQKKLEKYTLLKVDVTKNSDDDKALMKKFNLFGPPAMIFYHNGKLLNQKQMIGYKNPEKFLKIIK
jgi:thiol:disulfide interchange protein DsbD